MALGTISRVTPKEYKLTGADGKPYVSVRKGVLGGHRRLRIYGRLDCPSALRHIAAGRYVKHRVFFQDELTARAAGYRPCGVCMRTEYAKWKVGDGKLTEPKTTGSREAQTREGLIS
jgi:methylphosphotriester-DNA--protein-cysteine methyltransferase